MADKLVAFPQSGTSGGQTVPILAVDNGDGTYSLSIAQSGTGTDAVNLTKVGGAAFALGQALAAASLPVVLTAAQLATLAAASQLPATLGLKTPALSLSVGGAQWAGVPSSFAAQTADQTVFTLAAGERGFIQNLDTDALAVKLGASATSSSYSMILKACTGAADGSGGSITIENWVGAVSVAAMTGAASYIAWKQT